MNPSEIAGILRSRATHFSALIVVLLVLQFATSAAHADVLLSYHGTYGLSGGVPLGSGACAESKNESVVQSCVDGQMQGAGFSKSRDWSAQDAIPCNTAFDSSFECNTADYYQTGNPVDSYTAYVDLMCPNGGQPNAYLSDAENLTIPGWCIVLGGAPPAATKPLCADDSPPSVDQTDCTSWGEIGAGKPADSGTVGDPINAGSGNVYLNVTDYKGGWQFPLEFTRTYNSSIASQGLSPDGADQSLGAGWTSNVTGPHLYINIVQQYYTCVGYDNEGNPPVDFICPEASSPMTVTVWRPDGTQSVFEGTMSAQYVAYDGALTPHARAIGQLSHGALPAPMTGTGYAYLRDDGFTEYYSEAGQLLVVQDPHGSQHVYTYDGLGRITAISSPSELSFIGGGATAPAKITFAYDSSNRIQTMTNAAAQPGTTLVAGTYTYTYDTNNNLVQVQYPDNSVVQYKYEDVSHPNALTGIIDENGNRYSTWAYDSQGRGNVSYNGNGASIANNFSIAYNGDGSADVTEPTGLVRHLVYTNINGVSLLTNASAPCTLCGDKSQYISYDANGYAASKTDFDGSVTRYTHDAGGRELTKIEAYGTQSQRTTATIWNLVIGLPEQVTLADASGQPIRQTSYCYNYSSNSCVDNSGSGTVWTGTVTDPTTGVSRTTTYTYNPAAASPSAAGAALLNEIQWPGGSFGFGVRTATQSYVGNSLQVHGYDNFDFNGNPAITYHLDMTHCSFAYDLRQRITRKGCNGPVIQPFITYAYDSAGNLTRATLPAGGYVQYGYDTAHRLISITDSNNASIVYTLDALGNRVEEKVLDANGVMVRDTKRAYDQFNHLLQLIGGEGEITHYVADLNGNITGITDPRGNPTTYNLDALNRIATVQDPNGNVTTYNYNALDRLQDLTSPRGVHTHYTYDGFGGVTSVQSPDTGTTSYTYDAAGNIATKTDANGTVNYSYDAINRLTQVAYADSTQNVSYMYDKGTCAGTTVSATESIGQLICVTDQGGITFYKSYDGIGQVTSKYVFINGGSQWVYVNYGYDSNENVNLITLGLYTSAGGSIQEIPYTLDNLGHITGVSVNNNITANYAPYTVASNICYKPFGPICGLTYGNGLVETRSFDKDYRLTAVNTPGVQVWGLSYDGDSNLTAMTDGVTINQGKWFNQTWTYDPLNRVTGNGPVATAYAYDADGNRTQNTNMDNRSYTYAYAPTSEQLMGITRGSTSIANYTYNGVGAVAGDGTYNYTYHLDGSLAKVKNASTNATVGTYVSNALGQRVKKTVSGTTTYFLYDESGHLLADLNGTTITHVYVWLGDRPLVKYGTAGIRDATKAYYLHVDQNNTPRYMTDSSKTVGWEWASDPFGYMTRSGSTTADAFQFGSDFNLRMPGQYYDAETGKFGNHFRDYNPSTGRYMESDPIGLNGGINTYAYVGGNPLRFVDPLGMCSKNSETQSATDDQDQPTAQQKLANCINDTLDSTFGPGTANDVREYSFAGPTGVDNRNELAGMKALGKARSIYAQYALGFGEGPFGLLSDAYTTYEVYRGFENAAHYEFALKFCQDYGEYIGY